LPQKISQSGCRLLGSQAVDEISAASTSPVQGKNSEFFASLAALNTDKRPFEPTISDSKEGNVKVSYKCNKLPIFFAKV